MLALFKFPFMGIFFSSAIQITGLSFSSSGLQSFVKSDTSFASGTNT